MNAFPWTLFFILVAAGLLGTAAVLPYSMALNPAQIDAVKARLSAKTGFLPPMLVVVLSSLLNTGLLVAVSSFAGLLAARATGLRLPVLEGLLAGQPVFASLLGFLPAAVLGGLAAGAAIGALEHWVFLPHLPAKLIEAAVRTTFWRSALACFYGGIVEEILLRLFVMGGLSWLIGLAWHTPAGLPALGAFWTANVLAAILFGLGHLPALLRITPLTPALLVRTLLLNGIPGLLCGYLYMAFGLEAAMLAHFSADIVIHLVYPALEPAVRKATSQPARA